jgi:hypothetical protein
MTSLLGPSLIGLALLASCTTDQTSIAPETSASSSLERCAKNSECRSYLRMIGDRVQVRLSLAIASGTPSAEIIVGFRLDRGGTVHEAHIAGGSNLPGSEACLAALVAASPFPPPPRRLSFLVGERLALQGVCSVPSSLSSLRDPQTSESPKVVVVQPSATPDRRSSSSEPAPQSHQSCP